MKILASYFCLLLLCTLTAQAQKKSSIVFMGIPWGSTVDEVRKVVDSIEGISLLEQRWGKDDNGGDDSTVIVLEYHGGEYADFTVSTWHFLFYQNKLYFVKIGYDLAGSAAIKRWEQIRELFTLKYGKPKNDTQQWLNTARQVYDNDQEIWDEAFTPKSYLISHWYYKEKNNTVSAGCSTGDKDSGVDVLFLNNTISEQVSSDKKKKRLKGM